jgi:hypothetical protein
MGVRSILGKKREEIREAKQKKTPGKIAELAWRRTKKSEMCGPDQISAVKSSGTWTSAGKKY